MRAGLTISSAFHAAILGWGLIVFTSPRILEAPPVDSIPIDLVSISEFTKVNAGKKSPEKTPEPIKQVEKTDAPKTIEDLYRPIKEKEVKAAPPPKEAAPPPVAETKPKPEEVKPDPTPGPTPEPLKEQPKKAEKKEKTDKKEAKVKTPPVKTKYDFDPKKIHAELDRKTPSRQKVAGNTPTTPRSGNEGESVTLSMTELAALQRRVESCWNVLPGAGNMERSPVELRIRMNPDGTLSAAPQVLNTNPSPGFQATAESAVRAIIACAPYKMLSSRTYPVWKDLIFIFNPSDMGRG